MRAACAAMPGCNGTRSPGAVRVPCGKITTGRPSATARSVSRSRPRSAAAPADAVEADLPAAAKQRAEQRQPHQLALDHIGGGRHHDVPGDGIERRLVLGRDQHRAARRQVLLPQHLQADAAKPPQPAERQPCPQPRERHRPGRRHPAQRHPGQAEEEGEPEEIGIEQRRAQQQARPVGPAPCAGSYRGVRQPRQPGQRAQVLGIFLHQQPQHRRIQPPAQRRRQHRVRDRAGFAAARGRAPAAPAACDSRR